MQPQSWKSTVEDKLWLLFPLPQNTSTGQGGAAPDFGQIMRLNCYFQFLLFQLDRGAVHLLCHPSPLAKPLTIPVIHNSLQDPSFNPPTPTIMVYMHRFTFFFEEEEANFQFVCPKETRTNETFDNHLVSRLCYAMNKMVFNGRSWPPNFGFS